MPDQIPPEYQSKTPEQALAHVVEEIAEFGDALQDLRDYRVPDVHLWSALESIAKALRFGLTNHHPSDPGTTNAREAWGMLRLLRDPLHGAGRALELSAKRVAKAQDELRDLVRACDIAMEMLRMADIPQPEVHFGRRRPHWHLGEPDEGDGA